MAILTLHTVETKILFLQIIACATVIAGNSLASVISFYTRHRLRAKMRWLEFIIQLFLAALMTMVFPMKV